MARIIQGVTVDHLEQLRTIAFGSPEFVVEYVQELRREMTFDRVYWNIDFGSMPLDMAARTLTLFIDQVLSQLKLEPVMEPTERAR